NKVLDDVDGTQREAVETERRIGELRKELRKKFRINFAIGVGLMATGAWFAWFGPLPELVPAGVFAMSNSLAFIVRGLLTVARTAHGQQARRALASRCPSPSSA
ncbi:MAG: hypothetical protein DIU78_021800, partial [Pseudomonadota bacterium]